MYDFSCVAEVCVIRGAVCFLTCSDSYAIIVEVILRTLVGFAADPIAHLNECFINWPV